MFVFAPVGFRNQWGAHNQLSIFLLSLIVPSCDFYLSPFEMSSLQKIHKIFQTQVSPHLHITLKSARHSKCTPPHEKCINLA